MGKVYIITGKGDILLFHLLAVIDSKRICNVYLSKNIFKKITLYGGHLMQKKSMQKAHSAFICLHLNRTTGDTFKQAGQQIRSKIESFQNAYFFISQPNPMMWPLIGIVSESQFSILFQFYEAPINQL